MKLNKTLLMVLGVICVFLGSYTDGKSDEKTDRWVYYGKTNEGDFYYDKTSVKIVSKNIMRVSDKLNFKKNNIPQPKSKNNKTLDNQVSLTEIDCLAKTRKLIKFVTYNKEGKILEKYDNPNSTTHRITSDTIYEILLKKVCNK